MNDAKLVTLEQLRGFLAGAVDLGLTATADPTARYGFIKQVLKRFKYPLQSKARRSVKTLPIHPPSIQSRRLNLTRQTNLVQAHSAIGKYCLPPARISTNVHCELQVTEFSMPQSFENIFADAPVQVLSSPTPDIALWLCQLDRPLPEVAALAQTLSQQEHARAARFGTELLRQRWIAGRATLRRLLAESLGVEPHAVQLQRGVRGRPEIAGMRDIDFNISHTEGIALMGIARLSHPSARIGVDIEWASRRVNADRLARKVLTQSERDVAPLLSLDDWRQRFLRLWTCKEAMSKATGDALSAPFGRIDVSLQHGPTLRDGPPPYRPEDWALHAVQTPADLIATVAVWSGRSGEST